jgi:hypothetical protein
MAKLIINLDILNLRELFNIRHQRTSDVIERPIGLTVSLKINLDASIYQDQSAIPGKTVEHRGQALVPFHIAGTLEKLIEDGRDTIFGREDKTRYRDFIRELTGE